MKRRENGEESPKAIDYMVRESMMSVTKYWERRRPACIFCFRAARSLQAGRLRSQ